MSTTIQHISKLISIGILATFNLLNSGLATAQTPICYQVASTGQSIDLTALCTPKNATNSTAITATDLTLDIPDQAFLSAKVNAKITNRSAKAIAVDTVRIQINQAQTPIAVVPISINRTLKPGQSISAIGLFDSSDFKGNNMGVLTAYFQGWQ